MMATLEQTGAEAVVWDLSIFYSDVTDPALDRDLQTVTDRAEAFAAQYRGKVGDLSGPQLVAALEQYEAISDLAGRIGSFIFLKYSEDTNDPQVGALLQKFTEHSAAVEQKLLFFQLEWNALDDVTTQLDDPALAAVPRYRHYLEALRRHKPYQLSEIEEQLLVEKSVTGSDAWVRLFTQIMGASRYDFDGEALTQSEVLMRLYSADRETRRKAADALTATLRRQTMELTYIFNVLVADKAADDRRRGYPHWLTARNLANKASDETVMALVEAVTGSYDLVARHYDLKRRLLGYDVLYDYDRYAPLPIEAADRPYSWDDARQIVESAYTEFSPDMGRIVARFFDERWIHAALQPGKRGGAFSSSSVPSAHPFVLINYTGIARDVQTLAHELGHGVHQFLTNEHQGVIGANTPLTTSEMASVFGETLVFEAMMARESDPAVRLALLTQKIEDTFATVFRQISMNRFEDALHTARRTEGELSTERISDLWTESQQAMFGDSVTLSDNYRLWWSYIPHFIHTPGYVYAYSFGELLVLALFNLYQSRGPAFVPQYTEVLAAGDSDYPEQILAAVGVDLTDATFWQQGLQAIRNLIDAEEALAREVFPDRVG